MIPVHMELSKFTEMKVTPKVYCAWRVAVGRFRALYNDVFIVSKMSIQAQPKHMDGLRCGGKFATPFQQPCTKKPS